MRAASTFLCDSVVLDLLEVYSFGMVILEVLTAIPPAMADSGKPGGQHPRLRTAKPKIEAQVFDCLGLRGLSRSHLMTWTCLEVICSSNC